MRKIQALAGLMVSMFLCGAVWAAGPAFTNYSADIVTTSHGSTHTSKIYSKDGKSRMESSGGQKETITISRPDKQVIWILNPGSKTYMEMSLGRQKNDIPSQLSDPSVKTVKDMIGNETVEGHPAKKYHVTVIKDGKKEAAGFIWEAMDMNNFPVKHQTEDQKTTTVWKNVKTGGVSDSVFEIPAGYKKMDMPGMGGAGMMPKRKMK